MRALAALAMTAAVSFAAMRPATAQQVIADLSQHQVSITTGFSGIDVLLFGAVDGDGDVLVTVRGPEEDLVIRRKSQVNGIWINTSAVTFRGVPGYFAVAASRPPDEFVTNPLAEREEIGAGYLRFAPVQRLPRAELESYRAALIRNMEREGLFRALTGQVEFLGRRLFRTRIHLPANVPTGVYTVNVLLIRDGQVVNAASTPLRVDKSGISADIFDYARDTSLIYGLAAVAIALLAGWAASRTFQRA